MTKISNVYDAILTELTAVFPNKIRIPNAYAPEQNPVQFLRDSWGLKVDPAEPTQRDFTVYSRFRNFTIILTREVIKTDIQTAQMDTAVKAMLEDLNTLQKEFLGPDQFNTASNIDIANVGAFTGIEFFIFEKSNFITSEISFSIQVSNLY